MIDLGGGNIKITSKARPAGDNHPFLLRFQFFGDTELMSIKVGMWTRYCENVARAMVSELAN
jgi:hypothetical protein